jgi:hypothetical protein
MRRLVAVAFALVGCPPIPVTPRPDATDATAPLLEAGPPADAEATPRKDAARFLTPCESAYEYMKSIGCEPKRPDAASWVIVCQNAQENGLSFNLVCINGKTTPAAEEACGIRCSK